MKWACSGLDFLSPLIGIWFLPHIHASLPLLRDWNVIWPVGCTVRGPLRGGRGVMKGWAGENTLQPLLCAGTVADSSIQGPQCCLLYWLFCKSGSTLHVSLTTDSMRRTSCLLPSSSDPLLSMLSCYFFFLFLSCFHLSFCLSISFTRWALLGINASPLSSSKCYKAYITVKPNLHWLNLLCMPFNSDTDQTTAIKQLDLSRCIWDRGSEWFLIVCVPSRRGKRDEEREIESGGAEMQKYYREMARQEMTSQRAGGGGDSQGLYFPLSLTHQTLTHTQL